MKERPILFSAQMVRAILECRKSQTRRIVKPQPVANSRFSGGHSIVVAKRFLTGAQVAGEISVEAPYIGTVCPYGRPGDRLWVRETWRIMGNGPDDTLDMFDRDDIQYRADDDQSYIDKYRPSIYMPRRFSRIDLEITGVRVERLNDISEADAKAEGAMFHDGRGIGHSGWRHDYKDVHANARSSYARLWQEINGPGSWEAKPWVWVIEFKRVNP